ncbi:MAG TPA: nicotinate phosphoribosyltransferase [Actinomycetota bacterium]|nr:nicotinate phosphoribosyltransferase [Actinomycetota bacterium]
MPGGLRTDLYELNMAASFLRRGMTADATFSLYVRDMPKERGFLVAAGLEDALRFLDSFSFTDEELAYLATIGFDDRAIEDFRGVRFDGDVWAVPEGRIVHAKEPILEVTASIAVAQLVETVLLNQVMVHTTIASKAARYVIAAEDRGLVDFSFRRTHGVEAARAAARASAIVGFQATSNVEAAREFGLPVSGTMAHSFVTAFDDEEEAFRAFAEDHPNRTTFLVDTYDTLHGIGNAIEVIREVHPTGEVGVRLDSGDLDRLSREARRMLDRAGLGHARIFASGGLDEHEVAELVRAGAPVDAFGIGTQLGVSADVPYIDVVYKLVETDGRPVLKLSPAKATAPGRKQVWRGPSEDLLALRDEAAPGPHHEPLLQPVMRAGRRLGDPPTLEEMRERFRKDLAGLPVKAARLTHPEHVIAHRSDALAALTAQTAEEVRRRLRASD